MTVRSILDSLGRPALARLCEQRDLRVGGTVGELRGRLSRSFRGQFEDVIEDLRKEDLVAVLGGDLWLRDDGIEFAVTNAGKASVADLKKLARMLFAEGWEPSNDTERPVRNSPLRILLMDDLDDEPPEEDDDTEVDWKTRAPERDYVEYFWEHAKPSSTVAPLRPYQSDAVAGALAQRNPEQPVLIHVATGGGKTRIGNEIAATIASGDGWILWVTKDWRLLRQAAWSLAQTKPFFADRLFRIGGDESLLYPLTSGGRRGVGYTTLHTLVGRLDAVFAEAAKPLAVVWDECHWSEQATLGQALLDAAFEARVPIVGLTATPRVVTAFRTHFSIDFSTLVAQGFLARPIVTDGLETGIAWNSRRASAGLDFTGSSLRELARSNKRNRVIVSHYVGNRERFGSTIVFACTIKHANRLAAMLNEAGVRAAAVHYRFDEEQNDGVIEDFRAGTLSVLVNVAKLTHGVDLPNVKTVFMTRPTTSDTLYSQMVGRGSRRDVASGKEEFNIVEFIDLSEHREQLWTAKRFFGTTPGATEPSLMSFTLRGASYAGDGQPWFQVPNQVLLNVGSIWRNRNTGNRVEVVSIDTRRQQYTLDGCQVVRFKQLDNAVPDLLMASMGEIWTLESLTQSAPEQSRDETTPVTAARSVL